MFFNIVLILVCIVIFCQGMGVLGAIAEEVNLDARLAEHGMVVFGMLMFVLLVACNGVAIWGIFSLCRW